MEALEVPVEPAETAQVVLVIMLEALVVLEAQEAPAAQATPEGSLVITSIPQTLSLQVILLVPLSQAQAVMAVMEAPPAMVDCRVALE